MKDFVWVDVTQNGTTQSFLVLRAFAKTLVNVALEAKRTGAPQATGAPLQLPNNEWFTIYTIQPNCEVVVREILPVNSAPKT